MTTFNEHHLARLHKRVELKDPYALRNMALHYADGGYGLSVDQAKCIELLRESAGLGCPEALYDLGVLHYVGEMGLEQNEEEALKYCEKAAEGGILFARHDAGSIKAGNGDYVAGMPHWRLAASGGYRESMGNLIACFEGGILKHSDLAETLQAFYLAKAELNSEGRDQYIEWLKRTGKYHEEYDE